jgi:putative endopeptidase
MYKIKKTVLLSLTVSLLTACNNNKPVEADKAAEVAKPDVLKEDLDTTVNPAADFFDYANGGWIKKNPIPGDQAAWGIGNLVIEENLNRLKEIADKALKANAATNTPEQQIGDFWSTAMDSTKLL